MTLMLTRVTAAAGAPLGTIIGELSAWVHGAALPAPRFELAREDGGIFAINGANQLLIIAAALPAGGYALKLTARSGDYRESGHFMISLVPGQGSP
jgi:hypothetical protein